MEREGGRPHRVTEEIVRLFRERGGSLYGGEGVSQVQHALQAAHLAELERAPPTLICAALLHDIGHLLHDLPDDAPEQGIDDRHEERAAAWLEAHFSGGVFEPVRLHVAAKRYLSRDREYARCLSPPSALSLHLQGGPMTELEAEAFERIPYWRDAVRLRRWDDAAKDPDRPTPPVEHFLPCIEAGRRGGHEESP